MNTTDTTWLPLEEAYTDEFGVILPEVHQAARELWRQAENFVLSTLRDTAAGQRLMCKAAASVSHQFSQQLDQIKDLNAYLWRTFKRLVLNELEKENGHRGKLEHAKNEPAAEYLFGHHDEDLDRKILIQQIIRLMDAWTREVFELLAEGHSYEEIAAMRGQPANALRSRFSKQLEKIRKQLQP
ncbi:MAG: sigma-70 family RNA polymerase sigma factor [Blastocatellia bacterium]